MQIRELMSRDVEFIGPQESVQAAAVLMGEIDVGALPVGTTDRPIGVVTARDILYRVCAAGLDPKAALVRDVMSDAVFACREEDELDAALDLMAGYHVRRLMVRDGQDQVVGWITLSDISRRLLIDSPVVRDGLAELSRAGG